MMDTYTILRQFADSWALLAMTLMFLGIVVWAFRPGSRAIHADTAGIPFRHEHAPAGDEPVQSRRTPTRSQRSEA